MPVRGGVVTALAAIMFAGLTMRACREVPELAYVVIGLAALGALVLFTTGGHVALLEFR